MKKNGEPRGGSATLQTISREAGVSLSTVSRALRGDERISRAKRLQIAAIAQLQGYSPNAAARTLATRQSGVIGLVLGDLHNPFYPELLEALALHLARRDLRLMMLHVGAGELRDEDVEAALRYQIDGCIISSAQLSSLAAETCARRQIPMVMINRVARVHGCAVSCHNEAGGRLLGEIVMAAGYQRVAMIGGRAGTSTSEDRQKGFLAALDEQGLALHALVPGSSTYRGGYAAMKHLLLAPERPDAVFAINDIMALGAIDALRECGLRMPEDIGVLGFDDIRAASLPPYELTTVAQPVTAMVERAVELLLARVADPDLPSEEVHIKGELRLRSSIRIPTGATSPVQGGIQMADAGRPHVARPAPILSSSIGKNAGTSSTSIRW